MIEREPCPLCGFDEAKNWVQALVHVWVEHPDQAKMERPDANS